MSYELAQPYWLLLLPVWGVLLWFSVKKRKNNTALSLSTASALSMPPDWRLRLRQAVPVLRHVAVLLLIVAMARPQKTWEEQRVNGEGIDIMMALDISPSMLSRDFKPDRLSVTKEVAIDFVHKRPSDRIGLVVFSAEAFTHCPLTPDKQVVEEFIQNIQVGVLQHGTAIGVGLATALNRLKDSPAKSKIVVLLTDGENNVKTILPEDAANIAAEMGIKVYTIAVGMEGWVESPVNQYPDGSFVFDYRMSTINTTLLEDIARRTKGRFFRAYSPKDLAEIYDEIDQLEKTDVEITTFRRATDYFPWCVGAAMALLALGLVLNWLVLRSVTPVD